jgi:hypothetical protein
MEIRRLTPFDDTVVPHSEMKVERIMRTLALSTAVALLLAGSPALVQAQDTSTPPTAQNQPQQRTTTISSIQVVDVDELQPDIRTKLEALVANTKQEEIQSLRKSIDSTPQAVSALKAKGRNSAQVVAVNIDQNGTLTMFTKKGA